MSIKNISILMIVLLALLGLIQIFACKALGIGFYTISNALVWLVVYTLDKSNRLYRESLSVSMKYIELLENKLFEKELTKKDDKEI